MPGIVRHRGKPNEEAVDATNVDELIDPERFDRIVAMRAERDLVAKRGDDGLRKGDRGKRTTRYALARLAVCDRCGERMFAVTSPYKRKRDGRQRRSYVCANVKTSTGLCDQPPLDAERIDAEVGEYLDRLFVDFKAWREGLGRAGRDRQAATELELERARARLEKAVEQESKLRTQWLDALDDDSPGREIAEAAYPDVVRERDDPRAAAERLERAVDAEPEPTAEQVEAADAEERAAYAELRAEDPIWVGAPPPLRALSVPMGGGPDSHGRHPLVSGGLDLPVLEVAA